MDREFVSYCMDCMAY